MKKKILFVMSQFNMGGIEKEMLCLFENFDKSKYDIELLLTGKGGQLESELPDFITVNYLDGDTTSHLIKLLKQGHFWSVAKRVYYYFRMKLAKNCEKDYWAIKVSAVIPEQYDCAVAYDGLDMAVITTVQQTNAKVKILWEHGPLIGLDSAFLKCSKKCSRSFDKIVCVSEALKKEFSEAYDLSEERFCVLYNLVDVNEIKERAAMMVDDMPCNKGTNIVTVGRLHAQKGCEKIPLITRMLIDAGYDIYWYLVGDGVLRGEIESLCRKYSVSDRVILLGSKNNPFPYIKNCDIYVQTSTWEGWCLTVQEARILCKPMVVTPLPVLQEQIISGLNGLIAESMTPEAIFESIKLLLDHPEMQERFICELQKENHNNVNEIQKLYDMIELSDL